MTRARRSLIGVCVAVPLLVAGVVLAAPYARGRVRRAIEARCSARIEGHCGVGSLSFARDGVVMQNVHVALGVPGVTFDVGTVAAEIDWWAYLLGRPQGVSVRASHVRVRDAAALDDLVGELRRLHARASPPSDGHVSLVSIASVTVERIELAAILTHDATVRVAGLAIEWQRDATIAARWTNATLTDTSSGELFHSGACTFDDGVRHDGNPRVDCTGFAAAIDIAHIDGHRADAHEIAESLVRGAVAHETVVADGADESPSVLGSLLVRVASGIELRAHDGSLTVRRGAQQIVAVHPAAVQCEVHHLHLDAVHLRLGEDAGGPAADFDLALDSAGSWRADVRAADLPLAELARWSPVIPWHATENGHASIHLHAEHGTQADVIVVDGQASVEDFGLSHPALAHEAVDGLSVTVRGAARFDLRRHRVETEGVQLWLDGLTFAVAGWAERRGTDGFALDASLRVPTVGCDAIRRSLPRTLTGPVDELGFDGTISADGHVAIDTARLAETELEVAVDDRCVVTHGSVALAVSRLRAPFVQRVHEPHGVRAFVTGPGSAAWVSLAHVSPFMTDAVVTREDGRFYRHHGIDPIEIRGAIIRNLAAHRFVYGASTISMQLTKNIFLAREKTLVRKLQEVVLTWYLERSMDKDSILELYLNVVEFGPGIYGIGPAARFFFGREPSELTPLQSIYLATLLPNPTARFSNFERGSVNAGTLAALRAHARHMQHVGYLSPSEEALAENETLTFRPASTPTHGALTQTVAAETTDDAAAAMAPAPAESDTTPTNAEADETGADDTESEPPQPPVSLRTGGRI